MSLLAPWDEISRFCEGRAARIVFKNPFVIKADRPVISFTFDDFPRSALAVGGAILERFGLVGTYYASFGLIGKKEPTGQMFTRDDLGVIFEKGHELGCHTFSHCHSWKTNSRVFEKSIIENRTALVSLFPDIKFQTFSYPISAPRPLTKAKVAKHFLCSRGGGQTFNVGTADLNQLSAYFLEKSRNDAQAVRDLIDRNRQARGWLIFATHDISDNPTPFGCTPEFFEAIVQCAVDSGASIVTVVKALELLGAEHYG
jgi:peptidoglycan/xylan/chitin deacetylase (PgdA/CDA1 family)